MLRLHSDDDTDDVLLADEKPGAQGEGLRAEPEERQAGDDDGVDAGQHALRPRDDEELGFDRSYNGQDSNEDCGEDY